MAPPRTSRPALALCAYFFSAITLLSAGIPQAQAAPDSLEFRNNKDPEDLRHLPVIRAAKAPVLSAKPQIATRVQSQSTASPAAGRVLVTGGSAPARRVIQCSRQAPLLAVTGGLTAVFPGETSIYTVTLTNRDAANCGLSTFMVNGIQPDSPGWTRKMDSTIFDLNPGSSKTTLYRVTSSPSAPAGAYNVYVSAGDGLAVHNALTRSTYNIKSGPAQPTCVRNAPTLSLSGGGTAVAPGTPVAYAFTVKNNDTAACGSNNFSVANTVPSGWTAAQGYNTLTLAPGASQTSSLTVTSAASAASGAYAISSRVSSGAASVHAQSVGGTYQVQATTPPVCTRTAPELTVTAGGASVPAGTAKTYTVSLRNRDSATCAATTFSLSRSVPSGWTGALSPASATLAPNAVTSVQLTVTSAASATQGNYNIGVGAASSVSQHTVNTTTSYTVSEPAAVCTRAPAQITVTGGGSAVAAGTAVNYTVQVRNQDTAACGSTSFSLSRTTPAGWTSGFAPASLSVAAGGVASSTLSVTSPATATEGAYTIGLGAGSSEPTHAASGTATYTVSPAAPTCTRAAPTVTVTGGSTAVVAGTAVNYTVQVRNNDTAACAATAFAVSRSVPAGWTSTLAPASLSLASGQSGSAAISVTSAASATNGNYPVGVGVASGQAEHTVGATGTYQVTSAPPVGTSLYKVDISFVNRSTPAFTAFKSYVDAAVAGNFAYGFSAYDAAYLYLLDPQSKYCTLAVNMVEADVADAESDIAAGRNPALAGDSYLEVGDYIGALAMTMHACPTFVTSQQKTRWGALAEQAVWNVWNYQNAKWGGRNAPWSGWSVNNPGNNYQYSFLEATMSWALISGNQSWISFLQTQKLPPLKSYFAALPGGGSLEGTGYGTAHMRLFTVYKLWKDSMGEDLANFSTHATDTIPYWVHATVPTLDRFAGFGDQSRVSEPTLYDYQRRVVIQARQLTGNPAAQSLAAWWLNNISIRQMSSSFNRRYDLLGAGDPATPAPAQLQYYAPGVGNIFARTDWTPNAMWVAFIAGTYNESHAHQEQGGFTLFSQQDWQAVSENIWSHSGIQQGTETNNVLRFERSGAVIPQREGSGTPTLSYTPGAAGAFSATTNVTPVYGGNTAVTNWVRKVDFVGRKLTVTDNFALGSGTTATFQVNTPTQPTVSGNVITAGGIQIRVLSPVNPVITLKNWRTQDASEFNQGWRVDIGGSSTQYVVEILDR